jgi:mannose-6-phosphate isomerase
MNKLFKLENCVQNYAWGSHSALAELLDRPNTLDQPQAELWMGAHPKAPSRVLLEGDTLSLTDLVSRDPLSVLGKSVVERLGPSLPFLLKVLAVARPLSIQAHPGRQMAARGYARENAQGIDLASPRRNYRDDQHKPECVCAVTPFQVLCGFRPPREIRRLLDPVWPASLRKSLDRIDDQRQGGGLRPFFEYLMTLGHQDRQTLVTHAAHAARALARQHPVYDWMVRLHAAYPDDVGVVSPGLLNLLDLQPGEALFLPAGRLHAYLSGVAVELMANSDNVLRGGLTPKHVDVAELVRALDFESRPVDLLATEPIRAHEQRYLSPADEFELSVLDIPAKSACICEDRAAAPEILLCMAGTAAFRWDGAATGNLQLRKGESVLVPAAVGDYAIEGPARLYKATVNQRIFLKR